MTDQHTHPTSQTDSVGQSCRTIHPHKLVVLTEAQLAAITEAAEQTGNERVISVVEKAIRTSFAKLVRKPPQPIEAPPDLELASRVKALEERARLLASKLVEIRRNGAKELANRISHNLSEVLENSVNSNTTSHIANSIDNLTLPPIPNTAEASVTSLSSILKRIKKTSSTLKDVNRRVQNVDSVLQSINEESEAKRQNEDVSVTINADWTINLTSKPKKTGKRKKPVEEDNYGSPIPNHPSHRDDLDECPLSPFVTPRSKMRRRIAQLGDVPPFKLDMPR